MAAIASAAAAADDSAHPAASSSASPAVATAPADSMDEGEQATHSLPAAAVVASEGAPAHAAAAPAAAAPAAAAPAAAAPAVAAPLAPVQTVPLPVQAGVLDQRAHDALSPATQHSLQQACEQVRQAARGPAAATLRLCIALEHAAQEILAARGDDDTKRSPLVSKLLAWSESGTLDADIDLARNTVQKYWTGVHLLLATAEDRTFWSNQAHRVGTFGLLLLLPPYLPRLAAAVAKGEEASIYSFFHTHVLSERQTVQELADKLKQRFGGEQSEHSKRGQARPRTLPSPRSIATHPAPLVSC